MDVSFSSVTSSTSNDSDYILGTNVSRNDKSYQERITEAYYTDSEFKQRFRFTKKSLLYLESLVENDLQHKDNRGLPLTVRQKIMVALRFYATGCFQIVSGDLIGISQSTVCLTVHEVSKAFAKLAKQFIKMPATADERQSTIQKFYNIKKFPRCIGSIDGCHIPIKSPGGENAELFRNRKGYFSINVQAICDADCRFQDLVVRWHGSAHDQTILNFSAIKNRFENGEFGDNFLVGDGGYGCKEYLITPYRNPKNRQEVAFNKALSSTRSCIERTFGIWKRRFSVLAKRNPDINVNINVTYPNLFSFYDVLASQIKLDNLLVVVVAVAVLHNIAIEIGDKSESDEDFQDSEPVAVIIPNRFEYTANTKIRDLICSTF